MRIYEKLYILVCALGGEEEEISDRPTLLAETLSYRVEAFCFSSRLHSFLHVFHVFIWVLVLLLENVNCIVYLLESRDVQGNTPATLKVPHFLALVYLFFLA
jgi:hypothetical protein